MGFPSPAQDYVEKHILLDKRIIARPAATYFIRAGATHYREGILNGALLVVDASLMEDLQTGRHEEIPTHDDGTSPDAFFGVITYSINDMRFGEFDDCPVM